jgi:hypothetical protein
VFVRDEPHTILGVAPDDFTGTETRRVDVWVLASSASVRTMNWNVVGRLRVDGSLEAVSADAAGVHRRTSAEGPSWMAGAALFAAPIRYDSTGRESPESTMARWLAGVSAIILLIAFANVVNLLLVRLVRRRRELAVRLALGSGRARVVRLVALEGVLLALASGIASLYVTHLTEPLVRRALFADEAGWTFALFDLRTMIMLLAVICLSALVVGLLPALQLRETRLAATLRGSAQPGGGGSRVRSTLTVVQAALSVVLLVGAGLFIRSLLNVRAIDLGVDPDAVVTATVNLGARS